MRKTQSGSFYHLCRLRESGGERRETWAEGESDAMTQAVEKCWRFVRSSFIADNFVIITEDIYLDKQEHNCTNIGCGQCDLKNL